ncbi:hypothetical protein J9253_12045 [Thiothrix litoralis]|uniref:Uncharacterized protein n=1 Tax=Thiothrix litoralis TaxID=2891210 RepID=A0ABX7WSY7_9GAMM|nr:hypothetical protein [Thiothrix litoralis]QTR44759.1 hypothetical protein J9253_12045 [Thiothrix litoralis]
MKATSIFSGALVASVLFASSAAMAAPQGNHNRIDVNIPKLDMRIDAGVKTGKLTSTEEHQLRTELRQLGVSIKAAMKDRQVSKWERNSLENKEAALNKHITKLTNNNVVVKKQDRDHKGSDKRDQNDHKAQSKFDNNQKAPNVQYKH